MDNYLEILQLRLALGMANLPADFRRIHADWLAACQNADGGFSGREGDSDLYYTGFALRGLVLLDALTPAIAGKTGEFLRARLSGHASVVDFFSLLYACRLLELLDGPRVLQDAPTDWRERVADTLETFRTSDGGYNKSPGAASGSTYHTFLVGLCYQLLDRNFPRPTEVAKFALTRRRDDGGFVEVAPMRRSGTNPTAAGVGILHLVHGIDYRDDAIMGAENFLADMNSMEGGLRANDRVPLADLLSTFTAVWTLELIGAADRLARRETYLFARALAQDSGGFKGGLWDEAVDVEYTFYGLATMALLSES